MILDKIKYEPGGVEVAYEDFKLTHQAIVDSDRWIICGFGSIDTLWPRLDTADTLVFVDLPIYLHLSPRQTNPPSKFWCKR
jgi:hypothetical protein